MRAWGIMLGGLAVWAAHFLLLYGFASALPGRPEVPWLVLAATISAAAADALILWWIVKRPAPRDPLESWMNRLGIFGAGVSLVALIWQSAPALIG